MRAVVQRVTSADVRVDGSVVGAIGQGYMVLLGVAKGDTEADMIYICDKIGGLRVFEDDGGHMNRSITDVGGAVLLISQFTLMGDVRHGRRPGFDAAMAPTEAEAMYLRAAEYLRTKWNLHVEMGIFGADMKVSLLNDGPCTILLDSTKIL